MIDNIPEPTMNEPNERMMLTQAQIEENKKCFDKVNGPLYFLGNYCYVVCGKVVPFELRPYSTELIYCIHNFDRSINMLSRQLGKCHIATTRLKIRNKKTNEIKEITLKDFLSNKKCSADKMDF